VKLGMTFLCKAQPSDWAFPVPFPLRAVLSRIQGVLLPGYETCAPLFQQPRGLVVPIPARQFQNPVRWPDGRSGDGIRMKVVDFDADALCKGFRHVSFHLPAKALF
jgi:hypothetical protein